MKLDEITKKVYFVAYNEAKLKSNEFVTPEHYLYAALMFEEGKSIIENSGGNVDVILAKLSTLIDETYEKNHKEQPIDSIMLMKMFELAKTQALNSEKNIISLGDLLVTIFNLPESFAKFILIENGVSKLEFLRYISHDIPNNDSLPEEVKSDSKLDNNKSQKEENILSKYTINLTQRAKEGKLDPLIGREDVIERTLQILSRRLKNNPIHVGEAGVGKTAIVEGIAQKIANNEVPQKLLNSNIFYVDMGTIIAGTKYRGDFEDRLIRILELASKEVNPIIYIDEIHSVVGAGAVSNGTMDATSILKPYLAKGDLKFIGSTTFEEYKKHFEKDSALTRRFQKIDIEEPTLEESFDILNGLKHKYEEYHNVTYSDEVLKSICQLTNKYILDKKLPDKAIDVLDEVGAYLRMKSKDDKTIKVKLTHIEKIISNTTKIPETNVSNNDLSLLKTLGAKIKSKVFGQDKAVETVVSAIKASHSGLSDENKPVASLLFVGPTGVGKTEIAKQLANFLNIILIRFDMSEYQEAHSVARLIGSPPGYIGYDNGGLLTDAIRQNGHCVLLLDEIEKANPDILNILLQVMDYGSLTDNTGKKADFRNVIIIMTSNAGESSIGKKIIGFNNEDDNYSAVLREVEKAFSPEFRNRLDEIIPFNHINMEMAELIAKKAIENLAEKLSKRNIQIKTSKNLIKWIAMKGLSDKYGAREIMRVVDKELKKLLVDKVLFDVESNSIISVDVKNDEIIIKQ